MAGTLQYMPLYHNTRTSAIIQELQHSIKYIKQLQKHITCLQKRISTLLAENNKLKKNNNTIISKSQVEARLSTSNIVYKKHPKSFSNLATYLALEQCPIPTQVLTDDEADE